MRNLLSFVFANLIISLSACSSPSATICGVQVREGERTKIKINQGVLTALKDIDEASNKSGSAGFVSISGDSDNFNVNLFRSVGLSSDGNSVILRNAKAYQESIGASGIIKSYCEK